MSPQRCWDRQKSATPIALPPILAAAPNPRSRRLQFVGTVHRALYRDPPPQKADKRPCLNRLPALFQERLAVLAQYSREARPARETAYSYRQAGLVGAS